MNEIVNNEIAMKFILFFTAAFVAAVATSIFAELHQAAKSVLDGTFKEEVDW